MKNRLNNNKIWRKNIIYYVINLDIPKNNKAKAWALRKGLKYLKDGK